MRQFGLIGYPLTHSFSQRFFSEKFLREKIENASYSNFSIEHIQLFSELWNSHKALEGLNVTIPYKKAVIPFLDKPSKVVQEVAACNCIRKFDGLLYGYNTDVIGFEKSLLPYLKPFHTHALILGTGGAAAAVEWVFQKLQIQYQLVSREARANQISYDALTSETMASHTLIINTSPIGMYPHTTEAPLLPYEAMGRQHHVFDLIYNPSETLLMKKAAKQGATIQNGLEMLHIQAEESWKIWNEEVPLFQ